MRGNIESVELLNKHGQDLEQMTRSGRTPLHIAAAYGHDELVDYLLLKHCSMDMVLKPAKPVKVQCVLAGYDRSLMHALYACAQSTHTQVQTCRL